MENGKLQYLEKCWFFVASDIVIILSVTIMSTWPAIQNKHKIRIKTVKLLTSKYIHDIFASFTVTVTILKVS